MPDAPIHTEHAFENAIEDSLLNAGIDVHDGPAATTWSLRTT